MKNISISVFLFLFFISFVSAAENSHTIKVSLQVERSKRAWDLAYDFNYSYVTEKWVNGTLDIEILVNTNSSETIESFSSAFFIVPDEQIKLCYTARPLEQSQKLPLNGGLSIPVVLHFRLMEMPEESTNYKILVSKNC